MLPEDLRNVAVVMTWWTNHRHHLSPPTPNDIIPGNAVILYCILYGCVATTNTEY